MYRAVDRWGAPIALKELVFAHAPDASTIDAFEREGRVLTSLAHPRIPRFIAAFQEGSGVHLRLYLAQEYVAGPSALARLDRARFSEEEALILADELLEVLEYLHSRSPRLIHRDVKPANVILRPTGGLALVDFDAARDLSRELTHRSTLVGTAGYMAPEQYGGTAGPQSDLYSVGATLIHLLSGVPPPIPQPDQMLDAETHLNVTPATLTFLRGLTAWKLSHRLVSARQARIELAKLLVRPAPAPAKPPSSTLGSRGHAPAAGTVIVNGKRVHIADPTPRSAIPRHVLPEPIGQSGSRSEGKRKGPANSPGKIQLDFANTPVIGTLDRLLLTLGVVAAIAIAYCAR